MLYEFNQKNRSDLKKVIQVVGMHIGMQCANYKFAFPTSKKFKLTVPLRGSLPNSSEEKQRVLQQILDTLFTYSDSLELFTLFLDPSPLPSWFSKKRICMFDHHDDSESWVLNLNEAQYIALRDELSKNGLAEDLFIARG